MPEQLSKQENLKVFQDLQRRFVAQRVPASGSINLTHRCNLNCIHCYLGDRNSGLRSSTNELSTQQWLSVIDQITAAGCLYLLLSGGEVLLRPDFAVIYRKAAANGLLVTVFTNGTLLRNDIVSLFIDLPPQAVEISLYGASASTYENITGVKDSFERCLRGIKALHDSRIRVKLKTMILRQNVAELAEIERIAHKFGADFRMDPAVSPGLDSDRSPLNCRVSPAEAVTADFANPDRAIRWNQYYRNRPNSSPTSKTLYSCGAGLTNFHIDPTGNLLPCMMLTKPAYDLRTGSFEEGWHTEISKLRTIKAGTAYQCNHCDKRSLCSSCPAFFALENGSPEIHSSYLCELAACRLKALNSHLAVEDSPLP